MQLTLDGGNREASVEPSADVLLVDDNPANLQLLREVLSDQGYRLRPVTGGRQALAAAQAAQPDLILLDVRMPEMDGFETCGQLKSSPATAEIPVIFISALNDAADKVRALECGGVDFICKPFQAGEVIARVRTHLHLRQAQLTLQRQIEDMAVAQRSLAAQKAELQDANRELDSFTYSVAHDLRAPLRAINGFARILCDEHASELDTDGLRLLNTIATSALHMGNLIDDLLRFARISRQAMIVETVDMDVVAQRAVSQVQTSIGDRRVEFRVAELPPCNGDPALLQQVMHNLVDNAAKYSRRQDAAVVEVFSVPSDSGLVAYCVRDNGVGFDMQHAAKLFGVFERLHADSEFEGLGVGLALCRRIVARHAGRIWAESEPNRGATFTFTVAAPA